MLNIQLGILTSEVFIKNKTPETRVIANRLEVLFPKKTKLRKPER